MGPLPIADFLETDLRIEASVARVSCVRKDDLHRTVRRSERTRGVGAVDAERVRAANRTPIGADVERRTATKGDGARVQRFGGEEDILISGASGGNGDPSVPLARARACPRAESK